MIFEKLSNIQVELKAPKNQRNSFGNYNYRSAEDILEAVKPLCHKHKAVLVLEDRLELIGDRYYVKAIATLFDTEDGSNISNMAFAREEDSKKGMDASQITGSCSSYARKYAMNGLFNIDDTKDADTDEQTKVVNNAKTKEAKAKADEIKANDPKIGSEEVKELMEIIPKKQTTTEAVLKAYKVNYLGDLTKTQYENLKLRLSKTKDKPND